MLKACHIGPFARPIASDFDFLWTQPGAGDKVSLVGGTEPPPKERDAMNRTARLCIRARKSARLAAYRTLRGQGVPRDLARVMSR